MKANNSKSYLAYLNKLVDQYKYNNTSHHSLNKEYINADYSARNFKVNDRVRITKYKNVFSKGYTENWSTEILIIDCVLKANPWT